MNTFNEHKAYWINKSGMPSALTELIPPTSGLQILDLGCGGGRIASCFNDATVYGIDNSNELLQEAKQKNPNVKFVYGDFQNPEVWQQIPCMDLIISNCSLRKDYCSNLKSVINLCYNKLNVNGKLLFRIESELDMSEVLSKQVRQSLFYGKEDLIECLKMFKVNIKEEKFRQRFSSVDYMKTFLQRIQIESTNIKCLNPTRRYLIVCAEKYN